MTKQCADCRQDLPVAEFYWVSKASGKLRGQCKDCMRKSKADQRDASWTPSCSRCGGRLPSRGGSGRRLCASCFGDTYETTDVRASGSHRIKLKPCSLCGGIKERFARGKLCRACKPWEKYSRSLRRFGLTPDEYVALLDTQGHACYMCRTKPSNQRLCIDHDHGMPEGKESVRGLLCNDCNYSRLPRFGDDPELLRRAADYLSQPPAAAAISGVVAPRHVAPDELDILPA